MCVEVCPAHSKEVVRHKAIDMMPKHEHLDRERARWEFASNLPELPPERAKVATVRGSQLRTPRFEFSGACAGCGETPYLKLLTQLFGDRILVANATGCSSIYGGNLPTTPWTPGPDGRGPAWSNSLFEDDAEFGLGMRLALDRRHDTALRLLRAAGSAAGDDLVASILGAEQSDDAGVGAQRARVAELRARLAGSDDPIARELVRAADDLVARSVWIVGGDGWAYDSATAASTTCSRRAAT
jgi:pyruvate-ferredoxin/flavodoxin oxidoreductase